MVLTDPLGTSDRQIFLFLVYFIYIFIVVFYSSPVSCVIRRDHGGFPLMSGWKRVELFVVCLKVFKLTIGNLEQTGLGRKWSKADGMTVLKGMG
jgi:hypothetical protein